MILLLLLASLSFAQSTTTVNGQSPIEQSKIVNISKDVRDLQMGRPYITGQPQFAGGIKFADGTVQVTSPTASLFPTVFVSTYTLLVSDIALGTVQGVCYATATATFNGGRLQISLTSDIHNASANDKAKIAVLVDGAYLSPWDTFSADKKAMIGGNNTGADSLGNLSWTTLTNVSAGQHQICLSAWRSAGAGATLYCGTDANHPNCILGITEIK